MTAHVEATGTPEGWNYAYYIFTSARSLLFFTVVILIGAGWSYMKVPSRVAHVGLQTERVVEAHSGACLVCSRRLCALDAMALPT